MGAGRSHREKRYPMSKIRFALLTVLVLAATGFVVFSNGASAAPPAKVGVTCPQGST